MDLKGIATETLAITERGGYTAPSGSAVDLRGSIDAAVHGTVLYTPEDLDRLKRPGPRPTTGTRPRVEVTPETTAAASRRLVQVEGLDRGRRPAPVRGSR
jgi:hypothetical protein